MDKVALKIIIAGRTYPLTIKKEEEQAIKDAAERINRNIKILQGSYAVKDMQDLLAMTALQMAVQSDPAKQQTPDFSTFNEDIQRIIEKINQAG
jgi:cell division protein ZapA (FtsZ GTPase activity inhibitor)